MVTHIDTDFIIVGTGIAGLMSSLRAAEYGRVILVTNGELQASNSMLAQGGIAAVQGDDDHVLLHIQDTLQTGQGLSERDIVQMIVSMAPDVITQLRRLGVVFDGDATGHPHLGMEGAHSRQRILHIGGDQTGKGILKELTKHVQSHPNIEIYPHTYVYDLQISCGECTGIWAIHDDHHILHMNARAIVLATGGLGQLFSYTTNHSLALGDGYVLAQRAGATLRDMEFIQFHPTGFRSHRKTDKNVPLISEAVRGEGALLVDEHETPFMHRYHQHKDLAARDIVARAIYSEMQAGRDIFLDARNIPDFAQRFPTIFHTCMDSGINPQMQLMPVVPVAHYAMGGVQTDSYGHTSILRLFAIGEVASVGLHGANRLASNSLLEGLVMAERVISQMVALPPVPPSSTLSDSLLSSSELNNFMTHPSDHVLEKVQQTMWGHVGIVRDQEHLSFALKELSNELIKLPKVPDANRTVVTAAIYVTRAALWRKESRGAHFRSDFPFKSTLFEKHSTQVKETQHEPVARTANH
ncbi:MAG: L-aspartate oxidase [Acidibacillus sp.]|uniref:L-aspartate oxidase n=1 Tax=Sulfoacidibacillus ferrooxidans TaxID=2005001 RepID=A0A9X1VAF4_9BACL|nr:L-aspartate oxidase [Sulfoacidibacillus ferrooxidans]MCI0184052.1 L-aspartate oxidase [Sulfoacidibacillus ferrooxidans]MCY0892713.1 L-aspartate oxidase [Acidibacillus sp.]